MKNDEYMRCKHKVCQGINASVLNSKDGCTHFYDVYSCFKLVHVISTFAIERSVLFNNYEIGGLTMIHIKLFIKAQKRRV